MFPFDEGVSKLHEIASTLSKFRQPEYSENPSKVGHSMIFHPPSVLQEGPTRQVDRFATAFPGKFECHLQDRDPALESETGANPEDYTRFLVSWW